MEQVNSDPLKTLEAELERWRKTRFDQLIKWRDAMTALTAAVERTRHDDQKKRVRLDDMRALLITVVTAKETIQSAGEVQNSKGIVSNPAVIREIFGLTVRSKNVSTWQRQEFAGHAVGSPPPGHTIRKYIHAYVDQLASWTRDYLNQLDDQPITASQSHLPGMSLRPGDLKWLHATHRQLVGRGGLVIIWGLAGSGKTTLARQFAAQVAPENLIGFIRIGRRGLYEEDIRRILRTEGHDTSFWSDEYCQALFRAVVKRFRTIRLLVLDDARSESDISALLPESSNVPVLITTRERLRFTQSSSSAQPPARQLLPLTTEQSETFLRSQIPELDASTTSVLAKILGGHAETMHHVVRYLTADDALSPEALLEELGRSTHRTLTNLTEVLDIPGGLPFILKQLYRSVADDPFAEALLTSIIWTNSSGEQPRDLIIEIVGELLSRLSTLELQAAVHRLERLGLLASTETSFSLPRLTCQIMRDLLIDTREPVLIAYERVIAAPPNQQPLNALLQILRQEYDFLRPLSPILTEKLGITYTQPPALVALDDSNWALFTTSRPSRRQVEMYRTTPYNLLRLRPGAGRWEIVVGDSIDFIIGITSHVYPTVEAGWRQMNELRPHRNGD